MLLLLFVPQERKKEENTGPPQKKKKKSPLKSTKRKDRIDTRAGILLSYKQEMVKIINEYPNAKTWNGGDILN